MKCIYETKLAAQCPVDETACGARAIQAEMNRLYAEVRRFKVVLERIAEWKMPATGKKWPSGEPMSFGACYGSNGERDFIRQLAIDALNASATTSGDRTASTPESPGLNHTSSDGGEG